MRQTNLKKTVHQAPAVRPVRAVVVCRPPIANDARRLSVAAPELPEIDIHPPANLEPDAPDANLCRDIAVGKGGILLQLPLYGHRGAAHADQLCEREVAPLLQRLLLGESSAVIAYGQTGSGKSHTMGTEQYDASSAGPVPHSVSAFCARRVFELAQETGVKDLEVSFAAVEIYREGKDKERLFDLQTLERKRIDSFEGQAAWKRAASPEDLQSKLLGASFIRNTDRTDGNARSSRSHAIFVTQVQFKRQQEQSAGGGVQRLKARLMLVDLAGSERASLAAAGSISQKQGSGINVGLLYLGMVMKELSERGKTLNYRFSLLTEVLRPALGGDNNELSAGCNTLVIGCISPLKAHSVNTQSTLEFLQQAGTVKNLVRADVQMMRQQELEAQVEQLQQELRGMKLKFQQVQPQQAQQQVAPAGFAGGIVGASDAGHEYSPSDALPVGGSGDVGVSNSDGRSAAAAAAAAEERATALEREVAGLRRDLVMQRDRAEAYEAQLRQLAAAPATPAEVPGGGDQGVGGAMEGAVALAGTPGAGARHSPSAILLGSVQPPAAFLAAASPLLAASRGVAEWAADADAAQEATPAGQRLPLLKLLPGAAEICCKRDSHMERDQLEALMEKVGQLLSRAAEGDDRVQARAFAEAALYALGAYNKCLGDAVTRAYEVSEDAAAERQQAASDFRQLYEEKSRYMKQASGAEVGLAEYEAQVEDLQCKLAEQLQQQQATTPGRWSISRLIGGSGGVPAPIPLRSPGAPDSRRTSIGGSPCASPRASLTNQQLFGSPSRLGQLQKRSSGIAPAEAHADEPSCAEGAEGEDAGRRITVACVLRGAGRDQEEAAAAAAALACTQRKYGQLLLPLPTVGLEGQQQLQRQQQQLPLPEKQQQQRPLPKKQLWQEQPSSLLAAAQAQEEQQSPGELIKAVPRQPSNSPQGSPTPLPAAPPPLLQPLQQQQQVSPARAATVSPAPAQQQQVQQVPLALGSDAPAPLKQQADGEEEGEVVTPLESPEVSCLLGAGSSSGGEGGTDSIEAEPGQLSGLAAGQVLPATEEHEAAVPALQAGVQRAQFVEDVDMTPAEELPEPASDSQQQQEQEHHQQQQVEQQQQQQQEHHQQQQLEQQQQQLESQVQQTQQEQQAQQQEGQHLRQPDFGKLLPEVPAEMCVHDAAGAVEQMSGQQAVQAAVPAGSYDGLAGSGEHGQQLPPQHDLPAEQPQQPAQEQCGDHTQQAVGQPAAQPSPGAARRPQELAEQPKQPAVESQQEAEQQTEQGDQPAEVAQQPPGLPGPAISVTVPGVRSSGRGRGKAAAGQVLDYCPASGEFSLPGSEELADPLKHMEVPSGEPWQRRVLLTGSSITLEQWLARRMLRHGRCHFCCSAAPNRAACPHPDPAFSALEFCEGCHAGLEPHSWRSGDSWVSEVPSDRGYKWCCLCGGAGVGATGELVMCSACKLVGFCSGCLWRYSGDDLAAARQEDAQWECLLCRPTPKLCLAYISDEAEGCSGGGSQLGSTGTRARSGSQEAGEQHAAVEAASAATVRRSARQRRPASQQQQQRQQRAVGTSSEEDGLVVDLSCSSDEREGVPSPAVGARARSAGSQQRQRLPRASSKPPQPPRQRGTAIKAAIKGAPPSRRAATPAPAAGAAAALMPSVKQEVGPAGDQPVAEEQGGPPPDPQQQQRRKRHRLLAHGDLNLSPGVDGERPALQRQRLLQRQGAGGAGGRPQLAGTQRSKADILKSMMGKMAL